MRPSKHQSNPYESPQTDRVDESPNEQRDAHETWKQQVQHRRQYNFWVGVTSAIIIVNYFIAEAQNNQQPHWASLLILGMVVLFSWTFSMALLNVAYIADWYVEKTAKQLGLRRRFSSPLFSQLGVVVSVVAVLMGTSLFTFMIFMFAERFF